jgi:hypothetical protein
MKVASLLRADSEEAHIGRWACFSLLSRIFLLKFKQDHTVYTYKEEGSRPDKAKTGRDHRISTSQSRTPTIQFPHPVTSALVVHSPTPRSSLRPTVRRTSRPKSKSFVSRILILSSLATGFCRQPSLTPMFSKITYGGEGGAPVLLKCQRRRVRRKNGFRKCSPMSARKS